MIYFEFKLESKLTPFLVCSFVLMCCKMNKDPQANFSLGIKPFSLWRFFMNNFYCWCNNAVFVSLIYSQECKMGLPYKPKKTSKETYLQEMPPFMTPSFYAGKNRLFKQLRINKKAVSLNISLKLKDIIKLFLQLLIKRLYNFNRFLCSIQHTWDRIEMGSALDYKVSLEWRTSV